MNARQEEKNNSVFIPGDDEFDYVLESLFRAVKDEESNKPQEVVISYKADDSKYYIEANKFLKENKVIDKTKTTPKKKEEKIQIGEDEYDGTELIHYTEEVYVFRPKVLINFLINTSRIPKYNIDFVEYDLEKTLLINKKYILSRPRYGGQSFNFFEVVYNNQRKKLTGKFIEDKISCSGGKISRRFKGLITDLGFKKGLCKIFFPQITQEALFFRNNVFMNELDNKLINIKAIDKQIEGLKKCRNDMKQ